MALTESTRDAGGACAASPDEGLHLGLGALNQDAHPAGVIAHFAGQTHSSRQPIDEGTEANALDDPLDLDSPRYQPRNGLPYGLGPRSQHRRGNQSSSKC